MSAGGDLSEILTVGSVNDYNHSALKLVRSPTITKSYSQFSDVIISRHILELSRARYCGCLARDVTTTIYGHCELSANSVDDRKCLLICYYVNPACCKFIYTIVT